jgi:hypothetical protein
MCHRGRLVCLFAPNQRIARRLVQPAYATAIEPFFTHLQIGTSEGSRRKHFKSETDSLRSAGKSPVADALRSGGSREGGVQFRLGTVIEATHVDPSTKRPCIALAVRAPMASLGRLCAGLNLRRVSGRGDAKSQAPIQTHERNIVNESEPIACRER